MNFLKKLIKIAGPGVITGASDDDPSGIATYSQTGAQFGYGQLWTALFMLPFLIAVQEACARIGAVTGEGLSVAVKTHYSKKVLYLVVSLVIIANTINIGADIAAMAAAANLLIPINLFLLTLLFTVTILLLEIFLSYKTYAKFLKWLCLSLISYPITVFIIKQPWMTIIKATFIPHLEFSFQFLFIITGVFGTTISPYMFFWQAAQVAEEKKEAHALKQGKSRISQQYMRNIRVDTFMGMLFSEIATWSIIVVAATVLHAHNITDIKTAADAAKALEPLVQTFPHAGLLAKVIFSTGIIGLGLLSVPILAGSSAYACASALGFPKGLDLSLKRAKTFYGIIIISMIAGLIMNYIGINPIKALVFSAVINGVIAVPLIFIIYLIAKNKKIMGNHKSGALSNLFVLATFSCMLITVIAMFFTFGKS